MDDADWTVDFAQSVGMFLNGDAIPTRDSRGQRIVDDSFLLMLNAHAEPLEWTLPSSWGGPWHHVLATAGENVEPDLELAAGTTVKVPGRSVLVLCRDRASPS
jgi:glycogen operon protein